jgi:bacteriocin biosynthesis cyclodehydratase domain-containing protein
MHPILVPGAHVLRRDADTLQVGLDPAERVLLPDTPRHRRLVLEAPTGATRTSLGTLLLEDDATLRATLPPAEGPDPDALWARHSLAAAARNRRRLTDDGAVVMVQAYGGALGERLADDLRTLLRRAALPAVRRRRSGPATPTPPMEIHVITGVGEPPRTLLDDHVSHRRSHVLLRFVEGRAVVGPFVSPGRTACLRCLDLHRAEADPAWPLLVEQYTRATRLDRADGVPEPVDAALASVATGWVVRDVTALLGRTAPLTSSRTLTITADLVEVVIQDYPRRPDCGCALR